MPACNNSKKGAWTVDEDERLRKVLQSLPKSDGSCRWSEVSVLIPGRSAKQCRERWCYNLDPTIKKGPWTPEEDETLIQAQIDLGNRWAQIALQLPGRTENSVKTRHKSIMRAKKRAWTEEEDQLIVSMHAKLGCRWDKIAERLPLRTKNAVKTRYRLLMRGITEATPIAGSPEQVLSKIKHIEPVSSNVLPPKEGEEDEDAFVLAPRATDAIVPLRSAGLPSPTSVSAFSSFSDLHEDDDLLKPLSGEVACSNLKQPLSNITASNSNQMNRGLKRGFSFLSVKSERRSSIISTKSVDSHKRFKDLYNLTLEVDCNSDVVVPPTEATAAIPANAAHDPIKWAEEDNMFPWLLESNDLLDLHDKPEEWSAPVKTETEPFHFHVPWSNSSHGLFNQHDFYLPQENGVH